jgi:hypothetical protein
MRKIGLVFLALSAMVFTSCIEITEYLSQENGKFVLDTRIAVQKVLLSMAQTPGMDESSGLNALSDLDPDTLLSNYPPDMVVSKGKIDTDFETGVAFTIRYDPAQVPQTTNQHTGFALIPHKKDNVLIVDLSLGNSEKSVEENQAAMAILSGFKYRLMISKKLLPAPKSAKIVTENSENAVSLIDYPDISMVEVSMALLLNSSGPIHLEVE